jgi:hypothetical protein
VEGLSVFNVTVLVENIGTADPFICLGAVSQFKFLIKFEIEI